jgi:linoleoyl-CoA desaturase
LLFYGVAALVMGMVMSVVFQLAHCVEGAEFPMPEQSTGRIESGWAVHQAQTTVDFARRSRVAAWLLGGLNFHIEHHLFPRICHVNYPSMSGVVEQTCREFGVRFAAHRPSGPASRRTTAGCGKWGGDRMNPVPGNARGPIGRASS